VLFVIDWLVSAVINSNVRRVGESRGWILREHCDFVKQSCSIPNMLPCSHTIVDFYYIPWLGRLRVRLETKHLLNGILTPILLRLPSSIPRSGLIMTGLLVWSPPRIPSSVATAIPHNTT